MKIQWLGHAAFTITTKDGKTLITDPYQSGAYGGALGYPPIKVSADVVTVSHQHEDHNHTKSLPGRPQVIDKDGECETAGIKIKGMPCFHDTTQGKERGKNTIFVYEAEGMRLAHLGDLGHMLTKEQFDKIGKIDILLIPVGGHFTIDAKTATEVASKIAPKVIIPMHYKTEVLDFPVTPVDNFLAGKKNVKRFSSSETTVTKETLPAEPVVWVLPYAKQQD